MRPEEEDDLIEAIEVDLTRVSSSSLAAEFWEMVRKELVPNEEADVVRAVDEIPESWDFNENFLLASCLLDPVELNWLIFSRTWVLNGVSATRCGFCCGLGDSKIAIFWLIFDRARFGVSLIALLAKRIWSDGTLMLSSE